jgi:hypothetical protein
MSPPAKMPARPVIMFLGPPDHAILDFQAGHVFEQAEVHVLAQRQHQRIGFERLEFAGGVRVALLVQRHLLDGDRVVGPCCLMVLSHLIITPSCSASSTSKSCAGIFSRVRR